MNETERLAEWSKVWIWTVGTRVTVKGASGVVIKQNPVSVRVKFDDGRVLLVGKTHPALARLS